MHVPMLIRFPKKHQHLAPAAPGSAVDRLISFVDLPPSILNLCGAAIPRYMQGIPFLGVTGPSARKYVYGARDRVDEAFDLARSVRDHRFLYIRNFMPHLSYHQPSFYADQGVIRAEISRAAKQDQGRRRPALWDYAGPSRPREELYDVVADPLNLHNLAGSEDYRHVLDTMRSELKKWVFSTRDVGFLPEHEVWSRLGDRTPYEFRLNPELYPLEKLFQAASLVGAGPSSLPVLLSNLRAEEPGVRYWAAVGLSALGTQAAAAEDDLVAALSDPSPSVRIEAAGALARAGKTKESLPTLLRELKHRDVNVVLQAVRTIELLGEQAHATADAMRAAGQRAQGAGDLKMFVRFSTDAFLQRIEHPY